MRLADFMKHFRKNFQLTRINAAVSVTSDVLETAAGRIEVKIEVRKT
jgi:hypothetical protein